MICPDRKEIKKHYCTINGGRGSIKDEIQTDDFLPCLKSECPLFRILDEKEYCLRYSKIG